MGLVRALLPLSRAAARLGPGPGRRLLGAALTRCLAPGWVLLRPPPAPRRLAWAEEATAVYRALAETEGARPRDRDLLARSLVWHAYTLVLVGRCEQAYTVLDDSSAVPGARWPPAQRALQLHLRAQALFGLARLDEALDSAGEAVAAYRRLVPTRRDRTLGGLPGALRTYALVLTALRRPEESVAAYEECVGLLRDMSMGELSHAILVRVRALCELTSGLEALGRYEEALSVGREARDAADPVMVRVAPEIVRPLRVRLFADLARCLEVTGDLAAARTTAAEAVAEARALAGRDRAVGEPLLVMALDRLGDQLGQLGDRAAELAVRRELVDLSAALASERPDVCDPLLAVCLERLADCHEASGDRRDAVRAGERAVAAYRRAAALDPPVHEPQLARVLADLSRLRQDDGDLDGAIGDAREAVALTRRLAEADWPVHHALTAGRLRVLGRALHRAGDHGAAVACYAESEAILVDESADSGAGRYAESLAAARSGLSLALDAEARAHLAEGRADDAVAALRSLLALTRRADGTHVHARCVTAFADTRAEYRDTVVPAWTRATGQDFPTFVYRPSGTVSGERPPGGN
ncbi:MULTISPECIES: tetratricopeptide repeat protein [Streptomyces]|uniref:Tetratricopeptide repeat protein n=1 Tax=Streptomyces triticiradicis TaxID=2651189 RepID=A0A7J5DPH3_9ACTN|nr:tetratricopeptide repeat protein [Streptomyces triticiradicis]KAB1990688.1 tetratricopeptide repeat protein [Streptomyces triticiradicis]